MITPKNLVSLVFSTIEEFAPHRDALLSLLCSMCGPRRGMRFFVALNEAVNNALFHGNRKLPRGCVMLLAIDEEESLCLYVRSEGNGFEHDLKVDPEVFSDYSKEGGRGVQIILHVVDEVSIEESGCTVTLRMRKKALRNESAEASGS